MATAPPPQQDPNYNYGNPPNYYSTQPNYQNNPPNYYGNQPNYYGNQPNYYGNQPNYYGNQPNAPYVVPVANGAPNMPTNSGQQRSCCESCMLCLGACACMACLCESCGCLSNMLLN